MILMTLALFYTALLTPPTVAFHWLDEACDDIPTLMADTVVDSLFLVDILLTFVTGRLLAGDYVDDWRAVMKDYLKGGFWFDCATSIPVSYFEHVKNASCKKAAQAAEAAGTDVTSVSGSAGDLRLLRVLKPMRLLKIARVFKLGRLTQILDLIADVCDISPKAGKTFKVMMSLLMIEFLRENDCPPRLRTRIVQWTRFSENTVSTHLSKKLIMQQLPTDLRHELLQFLYKPLICKVPLFAYVLNRCVPS